jgi:hypothetical protein
MTRRVRPSGHVDAPLTPRNPVLAAAVPHAIITSCDEPLTQRSLRECCVRA